MPVINRNYKSIRWQKLVGFLSITAIVICAIVLSLSRVFNFTPDMSVPFPYIAPAEGLTGDYIMTTVYDMEMAVKGHYGPMFDPDSNMGRSFVFKDVSVTAAGLGTSETEPSLAAGYMMFLPQKISDLKALKVGDKVDVLGIFAGQSTKWASLTVFTNCVFLPAKVSPFPLPGGQSMIGVY